MVKISIIVPIFNNSAYLSKCIESLVCQTLKEIEIILINDGSKDNSLQICEEYKKKDNRIILIDKKNSGVSDTRNVGIDNSNGEFIMFVDSDDWLEKEACQVAYEVLKKEKADSIIFNYYRESSKGITKKRIFEEKELIFENDNLERDILIPTLGPVDEKLKHPEKLDSLVPVFAKIYKADIIKRNKIKYIGLELVPSECLMFNIEYYKESKKVIYLEKYLYHYRRNNFSSITKGYRPELFDKWLWWISYMENNILTKNYSKLEKAFYNRICFSIIPLSGNLLKKKDFRKTYSELKKILENEYYKKAYNQLEIKYLPIHWKIYFLLAKNRRVLLFYFLTKIMRSMIEFKKR